MATDYDRLREERLSEVSAELRDIYARIGAGLQVRELGVAGFREAGARGMAGFAEAVDIGDIECNTIRIEGPAGEVPTRIYTPAEGRAKRGIYVHTHGGGWVAGGGLGHWDAFNRYTAEQWGCIVVHPDFRLPPEHPFPAGVEDCRAVVQWVGSHADEIGGDQDRIAIGGGCTGANIAAVMAIMARDAGEKLALQILWAPRFDLRADYRSDFEFAEGYGLARDNDQYVCDQYLPDRELRWDWRASPVLAESFRGLPETVIAVGEYEILRDDARFYASRLRDAGVTVHYFEGAGQGHGHTYWRNVDTGKFTAGAIESQTAIASVVRRIIGSQATPAR